MVTEYMMPTNAKHILEENYPFLINDIMEHISDIKAKERNLSLIDIIMDFGFKNNISLESIGDAISDDEHFKSFIKKDCEVNGVIKNDNIGLQEW